MLVMIYFEKTQIDALKIKMINWIKKKIIKILIIIYLIWYLTLLLRWLIFIIIDLINFNQLEFLNHIITIWFHLMVYTILWKLNIDLFWNLVIWVQLLITIIFFFSIDTIFIPNFLIYTIIAGLLLKYYLKKDDDIIILKPSRKNSKTRNKIKKFH